MVAVGELLVSIVSMRFGDTGGYELRLVQVTPKGVQGDVLMLSVGSQIFSKISIREGPKVNLRLTLKVDLRYTSWNTHTIENLLLSLGLYLS